MFPTKQDSFFNIQYIKNALIKPSIVYLFYLSGPFVSAIGKAWHPDHFVCDGCGESLQNQGFIEEGGKLYCEKDYNKYFAPHCDTCKQPIQGVS